MAENEVLYPMRGQFEPRMVELFNPVSLMPKTFNEKYQMAKILATSGLIPAGLNSPEKVCVALEWGHELQLSPMVAVNNIAVINGKPTLSADIMAAVVKRSPEYAGTEWVQLDDKVAECKVMRRVNGGIETVISKFTFDDAVRAGLTNKSVWKQYPKRMLKHRCLSYALRDAFPDILAGLYNPEEMESVGDDNYTQTERNITPEISTPQETAETQSQQVDTSIALESILNENKTLFKPNDYANAEQCLKNGTSEQIKQMYDWAVGYVNWAKGQQNGQ